MDPRTALIIIASLSLIGFLVALSAAPFVARVLHKYKCWKKTVRTTAPDGSATPIFASLHKDKETKTPRMAGVLMSGAMIIVAGLFFAIAQFYPHNFFAQFNFINRSQTWIPLFTFIAASILGLCDDLLVVGGFGNVAKGGGIKFRHRLLVVFLISLIGAYWFHFKLGWDMLHVPLVGDIFIGWWYIPIFVGVLMAVFSSAVVDGLDGLAGGIFAIMFATFAAIAFARGQFFLAAFCAVLVGTLLAFLWFNIPPAKFYMGETGILGLTVTLAVVAFFTNSVLLLPIAGIVLVIEAGSVALQLFWKKIFKRKLFLIAPYHHHLEAKGWPAYQVTMRLWLVTAVACMITLMFALLDIIKK
ncbi:MAG: hypothetical protein NT003_04895 [Candidatus Magasanikbacteria bacterium]|nr:hypothetical protein [Candidatus Magasanikbacteria bacterium]